MTKNPAVRRWLAGIMLLLGSVTPASAQAPAAADMLNAKLAPKFDDINITMPSETDLRSCKVELVKGAIPGSSGWVLKDAQDRTLRRFFDSTGKGKVDLWSYYKEGVEVYREFDTTGKGVPNNFRWLNSAGMKWGVGGVTTQGKGYISNWRMISAEEVGYEAFQAVATKDYSRLQALFISENELVMLKLSATEGKKLVARQQAAQKKFSDLVEQVKLSGAKFDTVEGGMPSCETNGEIETIKFSSRAVRYQIDKNSNHWLHTGELIQVGMAWRLTDAPSTDGPVNPGEKTTPQNPKLQELLQKLADIDAKPVPMGKVLENSAAIEQYYRTRIALVQLIIPEDKASEREGWYKQLFDNLTAMAQNSGDATTIALQNKLRDDVATQMPGSNLAAYGTYRCAWTKYAIDMVNVQKEEKAAVKIAALQDKWHDTLVDFVKRYPKAEDASEALHQIAIGCEFGGKNEEAKRWYSKLADDFPEHHFAPRARGSVARLSLVGNPLKLVGPDLATKQAFDVASIKNKVVIVHYWSSVTGSHVGDFAQLKRIVEQNAAKGVELVSICLDDTEAQAKEAVNATKAVGTHLFQAPSNNAGGLNSPLAIQYGIHILPTVFIVGRDGRVTSNSVQIGDLDTELKKVL